MTTFDRYLLKRFLHVFFVSFVAMVGLYVVIDAFEHADDFFQNSDEGTLSVMWTIVRHYAFRISLFFDTIGDIVLLTAVSVVLSLLLRCGELNPILAAGIPTQRLVLPLLWGMVVVSAVLFANKELVIPRIASELQLQPGKTGHEGEYVESVCDFATKIDISADRLVLAERKLLNPVFVLPAQSIAEEFTSISGAEAVYLPAQKGHPRSGWLIKQANRNINDLQLTATGRQTISPGADADELFVASDIGVDHMSIAGDAANMFSIQQLIAKIKSPSFDALSVRAFTLELHHRLTRPLLNIAQLFLILPLIVRREARGLVVSMLLAGLMQGVVFGVSQLALWLANSQRIGPDLAAWGPVNIAGTLAAWCWPILRT